MKTKHIGWIVMYRYAVTTQWRPAYDTSAAIRDTTISKFGIDDYRSAGKEGRTKCVKVYIEDET